MAYLGVGRREHDEVADHGAQHDTGDEVLDIGEAHLLRRPRLLRLRLEMVQHPAFDLKGGEHKRDTDDDRGGEHGDADQLELDEVEEGDHLVRDDERLTPVRLFARLGDEPSDEGEEDPFEERRRVSRRGEEIGSRIKHTGQW